VEPASLQFSQTAFTIFQNLSDRVSIKNHKLTIDVITFDRVLVLRGVKPGFIDTFLGAHNDLFLAY
jgi:hypothetical protein